MVQCAITDSPFHDVVYTYCTMGYNGRAVLELDGGQGTEAMVYVASCIGLVAPSKVSYGLNLFSMEVPFAKLNLLCRL